jgi:[ribosomal protein S5]-alanine N-acetyltransferase
MFLIEPVYRPHPPILAGARVDLRPPLLADFSAWAALRAESRDFLEPFEPAWEPDALSRSAYRGRVRQAALDWREDRGYSFHVFERENGGRLVGGINLTQVRYGAAQAANLGYWMGKPHAGKGLMREALFLLLPHVFGALGLHRIDAACMPDNARSRALLARLGFREIGLAPAYLKIQGEWRDHLCYQLLEMDFVTARNACAGASTRAFDTLS